MFTIEMHRNMGAQISQFVQRIVSNLQDNLKKTISLISGRPQDVWAQSLGRGQAVALGKHL